MDGVVTHRDSRHLPPRSHHPQASFGMARRGHSHHPNHQASGAVAAATSSGASSAPMAHNHMAHNHNGHLHRHRSSMSDVCGDSVPISSNAAAVTAVTTVTQRQHQHHNHNHHNNYQNNHHHNHHNHHHHPAGSGSSQTSTSASSSSNNNNNNNHNNNNNNSNNKSSSSSNTCRMIYDYSGCSNSNKSGSGYSDGHVRRYCVNYQLGQGGFAKVYKVTSADSGRIYACKVINKKNLRKAEHKRKLLSEIKLHSKLNHENIVKFERFFEDKENVYIMLECCNKQSLMELLQRKKRLNENEVSYFMLEILKGVKYLHLNKVIHRDLKLGNILIDKYNNVKLCDFGLATQLENNDERKTTICGTPNYIAPEILGVMQQQQQAKQQAKQQQLTGNNNNHNNNNNGECKDNTNNNDSSVLKGHSYEVDIWSLGVIMYTMLIGKPPFETKNVESTYHRIKKLNYSFPSNIKLSNDCKSLIQSILVIDASKRPSIDSIMSHAFFKRHENNNNNNNNNSQDSNHSQNSNNSTENNNNNNVLSGNININNRNDGKQSKTDSNDNDIDKNHKKTKNNIKNNNKNNIKNNNSKENNSYPYSNNNNDVIDDYELEFEYDNRENMNTINTLSSGTGGVTNGSNRSNRSNGSNGSKQSNSKNEKINDKKEKNSEKMERYFGNFDENDENNNDENDTETDNDNDNDSIENGSSNKNNNNNNNRFENDSKVWVSRWVDYSKKYGIGYILSNGITGVYFNDCSKMIVNYKSNDVIYIDCKEKIETLKNAFDNTSNNNNNNNSNNSNNININNKSNNSASSNGTANDIPKKMTLLKHFHQYLWNKDKSNNGHSANGGNANELDDIISKLNNMSLVNDDATDSSNNNNNNNNNRGNSIVYVKKWVKTAHAILFRLNTRTVQVNFNDETRLIFSSIDRKVSFYDKFKNETIYDLDNALTSDKKDLKKRMKYTQHVLKHLLQK